MALLPVLFAGNSIYAQDLFGLIPSGYSFTTGDMLQYSRYFGTFGTARSSAMGGAFTSLGGDFVSIGGNPAGLGMYRASVWGFTPSTTFSVMSNDFKASHLQNNRTRFAINNIAAVLNVSQKNRGVVNFNLGFSYNKAADFNYRTSFEMAPGSSSLNDIFGLQLNGLFSGWNGIPRGDLNRPFDNNSSVELSEWGAALAFLNGVVGSVDGQSLYRVTGVGDRARIIPLMQYDSRGSVGEYNISAGMNIDNFLYLGFGIAIQDIFQWQQIGFTEEYNYEGTGTSPEPGVHLRFMDYDQFITVNGSGVNFKFGAIARPVAGLRVGIAVHTPSVTRLNHQYYATMTTGTYGNNSGTTNTTSTNSWNYNFNGPTRLMTGVSYTFGDMAVVAVDYERTFYNGIRLTRERDRAIIDSYREAILSSYRPANNVKIGAEIKPTPVVSLRTGYAFYGSPLREGIDEVARFTATQSHGISVGAGFRTGRFTTIDVAYIYSLTKYATVVPYDYLGEAMYVDANGNKIFITHVDRENGPESSDEDYPIWPGAFMTNNWQSRHTFTVSFNFVF